MMIRLQTSHKWICTAFCALLIAAAINTASAANPHEGKGNGNGNGNGNANAVPDQLLGASLVTLEVVRRKLKTR
jgi:hypothetical protein